MKKVLIEITELAQGGFVAKEIANPSKPGEKPSDPIYAERITLSKTGLSGRLHERLIEIFKKEA